MIPVQTTVVGYFGKPCTLFSAYDEDSQILVVSREESYRRERREGCMVITNDIELERDSLFIEEDLQESIRAFFTLQGGIAVDGKSGRLAFADKAARANPLQSIEKDGMDSNGQRFRVSESISSAHIAALATCLYVVQKVSTVNKMLDMIDRLSGVEEIIRGGIYTI